MWVELGLDLKAHDALLAVLNEAYQNTFLTQKNRPEGMKYFDFVMSEVHGLRVQELMNAKKEKRIVVGSYCVFVPEELILAVDGVSVGLCAGADFNIEAAERVLPRSVCPLIKSAFGFKMGKVCPYVEASDLVVGENTCDGKKKAYEILAPMVPRLHVIDLPQMKSAEGRALLKAEFERFAAVLEDLSGKKIDVESLRRAIRRVDAKRSAVHRLSRLRHADPAPISGLDALLVNQVFFYDDPERFTASVIKLADELEGRVRSGQGVCAAGVPRILISGCPMAVPNWKVPAIVESSGAVIVGEESCVGERGTQWLSGDDGRTLDALIDRLVDRYLKIDCAVFTPNPSRLQHVKDMVAACRADGVIHYGLQSCQPYLLESGPVEAALEGAGVPVLRLETDYSQQDTGQIRTRVQAFVERIGDR